MLSLLLTVVAYAQDLEVVECWCELLLAADLELKLHEKRIVKLRHAATARADEMIVMIVFGDVLVVVMVFAEMNSSNHAALD